MSSTSSGSIFTFHLTIHNLYRIIIYTETEFFVIMTAAQNSQKAFLIGLKRHGSFLKLLGYPRTILLSLQLQDSAKLFTPLPLPPPRIIPEPGLIVCEVTTAPSKCLQNSSASLFN